MIRIYRDLIADDQRTRQITTDVTTPIAHDWSGGPGGSHPRAPTERSVNLSVHSALLTVIRSAWIPRPSARTVRALDRGARSTMP